MNNELGNDISLNKFSQSSNDIISYLRLTNMTFNNKSNLYYGFYKKKYYFLTKSNSNIEDIIQKKHIIKKRFGISINQLNNNSIKENNIQSNIKTKQKEQKNEKSNDYLTDESTLYQSQNSIIEKDNFNFNKLSKKIPNLSLFQSNFDKKILTKNILQKLPNNINLKEKINDNLKNKGIIFNLKNKFHSRIQISIQF